MPANLKARQLEQVQHMIGYGSLKRAEIAFAAGCSEQAVTYLSEPAGLWQARKRTESKQGSFFYWMDEQGSQAEGQGTKRRSARSLGA
jgi:transposase-like protein